jgi:hypothetical protein
MSGWQLWVRDRDRRWLGVVDDEHSLSVTRRHLALGAWQVVVQAGSQSADLLLEGSGIVLLDHDGDVLFSGPKRPLDRTHDGDPDGNTVTFAGVDDTACLSRIVYPSPGTAITSSGTFHTAEHWTRTGPAETVIRDLVDENAGPDALPYRQLSGLALPPSLGRGASVASQLRLDNLLEAAWGLAQVGGIGFFVVQDTDTPDLRLEFYEPADKSAYVRFGDGLGNLASYTYAASPPEVTDVVVAIDGEGTKRRFYRYTRRDPLWPDVVVEELLDARDLKQEPGDGDEEWVDPAIASEQRAQERLNEGAATASVSFEPIDTDAVAYRRDYDIGDIVTAEIDLGEITDILREVTLTRTPDMGEQVLPSIGDPPDQPEIYRRVARLSRDVDQLKTRR